MKYAFLFFKFIMRARLKRQSGWSWPAGRMFDTPDLEALLSCGHFKWFIYV